MRETTLSPQALTDLLDQTAVFDPDEIEPENLEADLAKAEQRLRAIDDVEALPFLDRWILLGAVWGKVPLRRMAKWLKMDLTSIRRSIAKSEAVLKRRLASS
jgi:hypothetical protein